LHSRGAISKSQA